MASGQNNVNLSVDSIWDDTDLTYVMTVVLSFRSPFRPNDIHTEVEPF